MIDRLQENHIYNKFAVMEVTEREQYTTILKIDFNSVRKNVRAQEIICK